MNPTGNSTPPKREDGTVPDPVFRAPAMFCGSVAMTGLNSQVPVLKIAALFPKLKTAIDAGVAQWQSTAFVKRGLSVQIRPSAFSLPVIQGGTSLSDRNPRRRRGADGVFLSC